MAEEAEALAGAVFLPDSEWKRQDHRFMNMQSSAGEQAAAKPRRAADAYATVRPLTRYEVYSVQAYCGVLIAA